MILSYWIPMVGIRGLHPVFLPDDTPDACFLHQSGHTWSRSHDPLLFQFHGNSGAAVAAITFLIDLLYPTQKFLFLNRSSSCRMFEPVIVPTCAYFENPAHLFNGVLVPVLFYKSEYRPSPLEKMLTAFFRISRSS